MPYLGISRDLPRVQDPTPHKSNYPTPSELLGLPEERMIRVSPSLGMSIDDVAYRRPEKTSYDPTHVQAYVNAAVSFDNYRVSSDRPYSKTTGEIL